MTGPSFNAVGPFAPDLPWSERWFRVALFEQACRREHGVEPALHILRWGCHTAKRRDDALRILNSLPPVQIRHILATYARLSNKKGEAA